MMYNYVHLTNKTKWPPFSHKIAWLLQSLCFITTIQWKKPCINTLIWSTTLCELTTKSYTGETADQQISPLADITGCGWEFVTGAICVSTPCMTRGPSAHPVLIATNNCQCYGIGIVWYSNTCSCHSARFHFTPCA